MFSQTGIIFNTQHYAIHDGPGIRVTVFFKGCPLRCWWCHNPESHHLDPENINPPDTEETFGRRITVQEIMREVEKDVLFFDESGGGITISGGEPLMQPHFLKSLLESCKSREIHTTLDTCGYAPPDVVRSILDSVDLFLYDLKILDDHFHRQYTGVSNHRILENLRLIAAHNKPVHIRFPIIPAITDTPQNLVDMIAFLADIRNIRQIHLLPYHRIAGGKYQKLGRENRMADAMPPSEDHIQTIKTEFEQHGFRVKIGG